MTPSRLAVFSTHYPPLVSGSSLMMWKTVGILEDLGLDIVVYTTDAPEADAAGSASGGARIERCGPRAEAQERAPEYVRRALASFLEAHATAPFHGILSRSHDFTSHLPAREAKRRTGIPWIASINDPFPYRLHPAPYTEVFRSIAARHAGFWEHWTKRVLDEADFLIFPTSRCRRLMLDTFPTRRPAAVLEPCGADHLPRLTGPPRSIFTVVHCGDLHRPRSPTAFLRAWKRFAAVTPAHTVAFRHAGHMAADYAEALTSLADAGVGVAGLLGVNDAVRLMDQAHVLLVLEASLEESLYLPSKVADYASRRRPLLALSPARGEVADLFRRHGGGLRVDPTDEEAIFGALVFLREAWLDGRDLSSSSLARVFSRREVARKWRISLDRAGVRT